MRRHDVPKYIQISETVERPLNYSALLKDIF